jgi:sirohydrochlorin cobaltochelatase
MSPTPLPAAEPGNAANGPNTANGPNAANGANGAHGHNTPRPPLLLAAHGTRDPAGVAAFGALAERVGALAERVGALAERVGALAGGAATQVAGGFIELSPPPLRDAVAALMDAARAASPDGAARIVAVPLMLSAAGHAKGDIPAALARERARHPDLNWAYARPLGPHPVLIDLLAARIAAVAASAGPAPAVLVVGRGSTDPDANADVVKTSRLLWEGRAFPLAETAFVSLARPDVTEGLERCRLLGARRIVVARYFLFPGVLPDRVAQQAGDYARAHPELDIRCADVLGDCDEIAALVYERYQEALAGDIRMNCDMCVYRTALPGFEHRVGAPQHPHDHPHDHAHAHV